MSAPASAAPAAAPLSRPPAGQMQGGQPPASAASDQACSTERPPGPESARRADPPQTRPTHSQTYTPLPHTKLLHTNLHGTARPATRRAQRATRPRRPPAQPSTCPRPQARKASLLASLASAHMPKDTSQRARRDQSRTSRRRESSRSTSAPSARPPGASEPTGGAAAVESTPPYVFMAG